MVMAFGLNKKGDKLKYSEFKKRKELSLLDGVELETYPSPDDGRVKLMKDSRSIFTDGIWKVKPIAFYNKQVYIVCPLCGNIHVHGGVPNDYEGRRVAHCKHKQPFEEYELI